MLIGAGSAGRESCADAKTQRKKNTRTERSYCMDAEPGGSARGRGPPLLKEEADAGGQKQIVGLAPRDRVTQVTIAHAELPVKPLANRGRHGGIEVDAIVAA